MAIITVSRMIASFGDEICESLAKKLGYKFVTRKDIERKILELGFPEEKFRKYDERKPGFFASLSKGRDEYFDYLQTAILEAAAENNCVIIGRGSSIILKDLPNHFSFRFISDDAVRLQRLKNEFNCDEKAAEKRILESDSNRLGFHKSFFNCDHRNPTLYHLVVNTGLLDIESISNMLAGAIKSTVTEKNEEEGMKKLQELLAGQKVVNLLVFKHHIDINFLRASINGTKITLYGLAESTAIVQRALEIVRLEFSEYQIESAINVAQDFKAYGK